MAFKADDRKYSWAELEQKIQKRAGDKDLTFSLSGKWKKFLRNQDGFKVYSVDGEWVRNNLSVIFEHGGHGFVHEFIPMDEIWVAIHHPKGCACKTHEDGQKMSENYSNSTVIHEIAENKEMRKGTIFWKAHQLAIEAEMRAGLLKDSYSDL
jgi:hypothetical protein